MKKEYAFFIIIFITIALISCSSKEKSPEDLCGDGICQKIELQRNLCPEDCDNAQQQVPDTNDNQQNKEPEPTETSYNQDTYEYQVVEKEAAWTSSIQYTKISETEKTIDGVDLLITEYTVTNPTTGALLETTIYAPKDASSSHMYPAVILVPGGTVGKSGFSEGKGPSGISKAETISSAGFVTLTFSPDGREGSTGTEQYNGYNSQDGLYEEYRFLKEYEGVDEDNIGLVSYSYGVALASGMLGRYQPDIRFFIEWEGPVNRYYVSIGCKGSVSAVQSGVTCNDNDYWNEREALRFVPYFPIDYFVILQSSDDHVQPTVQHSVDMNNKAIQYLPWTRVNGQENAVNTAYTVDTLPVLDDIEIETQRIKILKELAGY